MSDDDTNSAEQKFLNATARAVGSTLGKLAAKTGLARKEERRPAPPARSRTAPERKAAGKRATTAKRKSVGKNAAATKKKAAPKRTTVKPRQP